MFCKNCGEKIEDGGRFCTKCGAPIAVQQQTTMPSQAPAYTPTQPNQYNSQQVGATTLVQANTAEPPKKKSKLLLIAIILAPVLVLAWSTVLFIQGYTGMRNIENNPDVIFEDIQKQVQGWTEQEIWGMVNIFYQSYEDDIRNAVIILGAGLIILSVSTILNVQGQRKNSRKMIMSAGIIYFVTGVGIPSAIMCFIAFAKMKKLEAQ
jgi:hypothetical protein